jgi:hypothetical protein
MLVTPHRPNYFLGPHIDRFEKASTFILNCPGRDGLEHLGTAIYEPKQVGLTCRGTVHHDTAFSVELMSFQLFPTQRSFSFVATNRSTGSSA